MEEKKPNDRGFEYVLRSLLRRRGEKVPPFSHAVNLVAMQLSNELPSNVKKV